MATVKQYRLRAHLTKSELAREAQVDFRTVTRAEKGQPIQEVNAVAIVDALAKILNTSLTVDQVEGLKIYQ